MPLLPKLFKFRSDDNSSNNNNNADHSSPEFTRAARPTSTYSVMSNSSSTSRPGRSISDDFGKIFGGHSAEKQAKRNSRYFEELNSGSVSSSSINSRTTTPTPSTAHSPTPTLPVIERRPSKLSEESYSMDWQFSVDQLASPVRRRHSIDSMSSHTKPRSILSVESETAGLQTENTEGDIPTSTTKSKPIDVAEASNLHDVDGASTLTESPPPASPPTRRYKSLRVPSPHKDSSEPGPLPGLPTRKTIVRQGSSQLMYSLEEEPPNTRSASPPPISPASTLSLLPLPSFHLLDIDISDFGLGFDLQSGELGAKAASGMQKEAGGALGVVMKSKSEVSLASSSEPARDVPPTSPVEAISKAEGKNEASLKSRKSGGLANAEGDAGRSSSKERAKSSSTAPVVQLVLENLRSPSNSKPRTTDSERPEDSTADDDDDKPPTSRTMSASTNHSSSPLPSPIDSPTGQLDEPSLFSQTTTPHFLKKRPSFASATSCWSSVADHDETASEYAASHMRRGSIGNSDDEGEAAVTIAGDGDVLRQSSSTLASSTWYGTDTSEVGTGTTKRERRATMANINAEMRVVDWSNRALTRVASVPDDTTHLLLSFNALSTLFFPSLPTETLQVLDLSHNSLSDLPAELAQLRGLQQLLLRENLFEKVPEVLGVLTELEVLDIGSNKIETLAPSLENLKQLHHLDISGNRLTFLPPFLSNLQNITTLIVDGNPFVHPYSDLAKTLLQDSLPPAKKKKSSKLLKKHGSLRSRERQKIIALAAGRATTDSDTEGKSITDGEGVVSRNGSKKGKKKTDKTGEGFKHSRSLSVVDMKTSGSFHPKKPDSPEQAQRAQTMPVEKTTIEKGREKKTPTEKGPVSNSGESRPVSNSGESRPVSNSGESRPVSNSGESRPVLNSGESRPVLNSGESRPVSEPWKNGVNSTNTHEDKTPLRRAKSMNFTPTPEASLEEKLLLQESYVRMLRHERSFGSDLRVSAKRPIPPPITVPSNDSKALPSVSSSPDRSMDQEKEKELTPKKSAFGRWLAKRKPGSKGVSAPATPATSPKRAHHGATEENMLVPQRPPMQRKRSNTVEVPGTVGRDSGYVSKQTSIDDVDGPSSVSTSNIGQGSTPSTATEEQKARRCISRQSWQSIDEDSDDGNDNDLDADVDDIETDTRNRAEDRREIEVLTNSTSRRNSTDLSSPEGTSQKSNRPANPHRQQSSGAEDLSTYRNPSRTASMTSLSSDSSSVSSVAIGSPSAVTAGPHARPISMFSTITSSLPENYHPILKNPSPSPTLIRLFRYLRDLYDLDPTTWQLEEVQNWKRMWNQTGRSEEQDDASSLEQKEKKDDDGAMEAAETKKSLLAANPKRRFNVIKEILNTERIYVNGLQDLVEIYITTSTDYINADERKAVFSDVQNILTFHKVHFLPALEAEVSKLDAEIAADDEEVEGRPKSRSIEMCCVGKVFNELAPYMKMYSFYINNFDNALALMRKWQHGSGKRKKARAFLEQCKLHPKHTQLNLQGYLLLPIQRIPRYKMLLEELLRNTTSSHPDYAPLKKAAEDMLTRAAEMNERKRDYEKHERVVEIQAMVKWTQKDPLVQPHRRLVREGVLHLHHYVRRQRCFSVTSGAAFQLSEKAADKEYVFYLFNDIMVQCRPSTAVYSDSLLDVVNIFVLETRLEPASIRNREPTDTLVTTAGELAPGKNDVILRVVDAETVYYFIGTSEELVSWRRAINTRW